MACLATLLLLAALPSGPPQDLSDIASDDAEIAEHWDTVRAALDDEAHAAGAVDQLRAGFFHRDEARIVEARWEVDAFDDEDQRAAVGLAVLGDFVLPDIPDERLHALAASDRASRRELGLWGLAVRASDDRDAGNALVDGLGSEDARVRCTAAWGLGRRFHDGPSYWPFFPHGTPGGTALGPRDGESLLGIGGGAGGRFGDRREPTTAEIVARWKRELGAWREVVAVDPLESRRLDRPERRRAAALEPLLEDPDEDVRTAAVWALGRAGESGVAARPALFARRDQPNGMVRPIYQAALEMGSFDEIVDELLAGLDEDDYVTRELAARALRQELEEDAAEPLARRLLEEEHGATRVAILIQLASLPELPDEAWPGVAHALRAGEPRAAGLLLRRGAAALDDLSAALDVEDDDVRGVALHALGELGSAARPVLQRIATIRDDDDESEAIREAAHDTVRAIRRADDADDPRLPARDLRERLR